jgi:hypothetical protein
VPLDLADLDARARAAAAATGMAADTLIVDLVPSVRSTGLPPFAPALHLSMSALQVRLVGNAASLVVVDPATVERTTVAPRSLMVGGISIPVSTARTASANLALGSLLVAAVLFLVLLRTTPAGEDAEIMSRYGSLLVAVQPMVAPAGRPLVDVPEFATLAKIAERYGLLVLHWTRSGVGTFVVQDESTTYRFRASADTRRHAPKWTALDAPCSVEDPAGPSTALKQLDARTATGDAGLIR